MDTLSKKLIWFAGAVIVVVLILLFASTAGRPQVPLQTPPQNLPQNQTPPVGWVATSTVAPDGTNVTFYYPPLLSTKYVRAVDWPPALAFQNQPFACTESGSKILPAGQTRLETVSGNQYCVTRESQGAAGSIYTNYAYAFPTQNRESIFTFSLQYPQCVNYDEPKRSECQNEEDSFDIGPIVDQIVHTLTLK